jgi:hypothetical protein
MNVLPDEFLLNVIRRGGPEEGLSPGMPAFGQYLGEAQSRQVIAYLRSPGRGSRRMGRGPSWRCPAPRGSRCSSAT